MKLEKIASLALAGVMAVSMLAGCKGNGTDNAGSSSSEQTATATGYSAKLADEMKDLAAEDYISFKDNASDEAALKAAVAGLSNQTVGVPNSSNIVWMGPASRVATDFDDKAKLDEYFNAGNNALFTTTEAKAHLNGTYKIGFVYAADGSVGMDKVMEMIATNLDFADRVTDGLVEDSSKIAGVTSSSTKYDYTYEISVSVVNVPNEYDLQHSFSTNFIAVTITRTGVDA